jgi:hypothetical protein
LTTPPPQPPAPVVLTEASGIANAFNPALPPPALLINLAGAGMVMPRCLYVAAKLGLADLLAQGPLEVEELARRTESDKNALMRVMSTLESMGIFAREGQSSFRNSRLSEFLRADVPGSARPWVLFAGSEWMWEVFGKMPGVVKSGVNVFDDQYKTPMFEWIAKHPTASQEFNNGMTAMSDVSSMMVVQALDFTGVKSVTDVGGGVGSLLSAVLRANPGLQGLLFEQPQVIESARSQGPLSDLVKEGRCTFASGNFFKEQPEGMDAYLMKWILHDWNDEQVKQILSVTRKAAGKPGKKLFIVELVIDVDPQKALDARVYDMAMLVMQEGRERNEQEFRSLLAASGFELKRVVPTLTPYRVLEAVSV